MTFSFLHINKSTTFHILYQWFRHISHFSLTLKVLNWIRFHMMEKSIYYNAVFYVYHLIKRKVRKGFPSITLHFRIELQPLNIIIQARKQTHSVVRSSKDNVNNFRELFQFEANLLFNTYKLNETPNNTAEEWKAMVEKKRSDCEKWE